MNFDEMERTRSALACIEPYGDENWHKVGMALKSEFGEDGWTLLDEWSRPSDNYNVRENRARWRSFKPAGGITIATVYRMARDGGWRDDGTQRVPDPEELAHRRRERAEADAKAKASRDAAAAETARKARAIWSMAIPATAATPYCRLKRFVPSHTLREISVDKAATVLAYPPSAKGEPLQGTCLVVPIKVGDQLSSLQLIDHARRKHFLKDGTIGGGYWAAQALPEGDGSGLMVLIGEGVATVLSALATIPSAVGVAAMTNGNIPAVARQLLERYPRADLVILADLDKTTGKPDAQARKAAEEVGGRLAVPEFTDGLAPDRKDINDLACLEGHEAVRRVIMAAKMPGQAQSPAEKNPEKPKAKVTLVVASSIEPEPISWLWEGFLARGKVHILAGKPAAGKTTLAIAMAAIITTGDTWPNGTRCQPRRVVIWSGEDDPADTLVPRLIAAGANLNLVNFVSGAIEDKEPVPFDPAKHLPALAEVLSTMDDVALLIVDPVVSAVAGDSYKNAEVRRALQPLADLAAQSDSAVLGITHFTKGTGGRDPVERLTGSLAFGAVARVVLVAAKAEHDDEEVGSVNAPSRVMLRAKSNIGPDGGGFEYELEQRALPGHGIITSAVKWGAAVQGSARELLAETEATGGEDRDSLDDAIEWLRGLLDDGPVETLTIKSKAKGAGHSWATIRRAKKRLGIIPRKQGMTRGWTWEVTRRCSQTPEDAPSKMRSTFASIEHLRSEFVSDDVVEGTL